MKEPPRDWMRWGARDAWPTLTIVEACYVKLTLERTEWNVTEAAKLLGTTRQTLRRKIRKAGLK